MRSTIRIERIIITKSHLFRINACTILFIIVLDYGFKNTGSTQSAITYLDGENGILRYRGYTIEELAENGLHFGNPLANTQFAAELRFQILRSRQVICVNMRINDPSNREARFFNVIDDYVSGRGRCAARDLIIIQQRIDDRTLTRLWISGHVTDVVGDIIKE